jgi:hypothetical protein
LIASGLTTRAGLHDMSPAQVRLWSLLVEERELNRALLVGVATWEPKKLSGEMNRIRDDLSAMFGAGTAPDTWEPPSRERILRRMRAAGQID